MGFRKRKVRIRGKTIEIFYPLGFILSAEPSSAPLSTCSGFAYFFLAREFSLFYYLFDVVWFSEFPKEEIRREADRAKANEI